MDDQSAEARKEVVDEIENRETFTYKCTRWWRVYWLDYRCCCCCRPKSKREDYLFKSARSKLNEELDILEIVKKLRVSHFANQITLKPHQRDLVNFFQEYKAQDPEGEKQVSSNLKDLREQGLVSSRQLGIANVDQQLNHSDEEKPQEQQPEEPLDVNQQACVQLFTSINELDPNETIDKRVIARVTTKVPTQARFSDGRVQLLSAQEVRQDMDILKVIRDSRRTGHGGGLAHISASYRQTTSMAMSKSSNERK